MTSDISTRGKVFMVLLALQYGWHMLLIKFCIPREVIPSSLVIVQEVIKFGMCLILLPLEGYSIGKAAQGWTVASSLTGAALPAAIYSFQNWLISLSSQHMDGLSFNLFNQTKLIWTALFVYVLVGQPQSRMQLVALGLIFATATIISMKKQEEGEHKDNEFYLGILPNLLASLTSGFAAGLSQKILQKQQRNSYIYTMELCVYSLITIVASLAWSPDGVRMMNEGFFAHWKSTTVIPMINNAAGGIFTGMVVKYAGGVQKGFSIIFALMITAILQWAILSMPFNTNLILALPLGIMGLWIHTNFPYKAAPKEKKEK